MIHPEVTLENSRYQQCSGTNSILLPIRGYFNATSLLHNNCYYIPQNDEQATQLLKLHMKVIGVLVLSVKTTPFIPDQPIILIYKERCPRTADL